MKSLRWARLRAFWPEYLLVPIVALSLLGLHDVLDSIPFADLSQLLGVSLVETLLPACLVYICAHVLRAARLSLLLGAGKLPFSAILGCHSFLSLVTFAVPYKLGEVARALEFYRLTGSNPRAIFAIWLYRCFDAAILIFLIEMASSSLPDSTLAQLTRRGLLVLLGLSFFVAVFGRSALGALLRLLSASGSRRSLNLMRYVRKIEAVFSHMPPLTKANLSLLLILSSGIWTLEIASVLIIMTGLTGWQHGAVTALVDFINSAVTGADNASVVPLLVYRIKILGSLAVIVLFTIGAYVRARLRVWPKVDRAQLYRFAPRDVMSLDEQNARTR